MLLNISHVRLARCFKLYLYFLKDLNSKSPDNEVLKNIMVDLLKLQFSLEDNLLLMKQLNCFPTENEKKDVIVNAGRLQIALISSVNQLGFQWMSCCPLFTNLETGTNCTIKHLKFETIQNVKAPI